ncbi:MAG TPA: response regulator, partial [Kofleriaceae bacterium]|nr:response regulator [Kofleriaceae bacterium]
STFSVVVRLAPGEPAEIDDTGDLGDAVIAGRRALIVEPNPTAAAALADLLRGFRVVCDVVATPAAAAVCLAAGVAGRARHDLVVSSVALAGELGDPPPALIQLVRDGDERERARTAKAIELPKPVRRWRLIGALRHAFASPGTPRRRTRPPFQVTTGVRRMLGLRVLIAEDNLINQEVTIGMLADLGCTSLCVPDGRQVLDALDRESFDLVLMDCQMPVMDGFEATRELRRREAADGRHQLVIALTANATAEDREACKVAGMDDFLSKPFQRRELAAMLLRHMPSQPPMVALPATVALAPAPPPAAPPAPAAAAPPIPRTTSRTISRLASIPILTAAPAPPPAGAALDVLDRGVLDRIRAIQRPERPDLVRRVLTIYLERSPVQVQAIHDAAAAGDRQQLVRAAHDLKGGSGNLGLLQVADLLARIEQAAKQDRLAEIGPLVTQLPILHAAALSAVRAELARATPT